jgi:ABC-2 type transport system ATP-binding protein
MSIEQSSIVTNGLTKRYGRDTALNNVDVRVPDGAFYVLVGENGAGKSTTFKILMNLVRADEGRAEIMGLDSVERGPDVRANVGYVPEHASHTYSWLTCSEVLAHVSAFYPSWDTSYAIRLAEVLGLQTKRRVGSLSKGETRRLQLVSALAHRPPVLLLDEPTDGLDPLVRKRLLTLLAEHLADTPTTLMVCTHHVHEFEGLADHVGVLQSGRLVAQMSRDEMRRTVKRYELEVPENWTAPSGMRMSNVRRSSSGRACECIVVGEDGEVTPQISSSGAQVRDVRSVSLEEAAVLFLSGEAQQ